jgi:uncharacterized protein (TIGR02246 family)
MSYFAIEFSELLNPGVRVQSLQAIIHLSSAPLQNRLRVVLFASTQDVWSLVGDLSRFPEYSAGLEQVEVKLRAEGEVEDHPSEYVCHFKPTAPGVAGVTHRERVRWFESGRGYASTPEADNVFGLRDALNIVTIDAHPNGSLLTWDEFFDAADVEFNRTAYDQAFADIADRLIARFGGQVVERYAADAFNRTTSTSDAARAVAAFVRAMNRGDLEAALAFYERDAVLLAQPAQLARGIDEIREALRGFIALRPTLITQAADTWLCGDVALYVARWSLTGLAPDGAVVNMSGVSADVLRRRDGRWLIAVDNPWGSSALAGEPS